MGIYTNGTIFGIKIYNYINEDYPNILFEKKYDEIMSHEQMKEVYLFYNELNNKKEICFQYYTECSDTYGVGSYLCWCPMSYDHFLEKFEIKNEKKRLKTH
jgi:hypothetical protein